MNENLGFSISYSPWFNQIVKDINLAYLTGYKKIGDKQAIATSLKYFSMGTINFVDEFKEPRGVFSPREFALDFAYARKFSDYISGSVALRYIYSNLSKYFFYRRRNKAWTINGNRCFFLLQQRR